jgi:hypothetical protein
VPDGGGAAVDEEPGTVGVVAGVANPEALGKGVAPSVMDGVGEGDPKGVAGTSGLLVTSALGTPGEAAGGRGVV